MTDRDHATIARAYRRFAEREAHGRSALYEAFAYGVAQDLALLERLADLPAAKRQPNLLFAAVRDVTGLAADWPDFRTHALGQWEAVQRVMLQRSTQTNEPGRCAVLLPVLSQLPQPIALLEVGASAGLCLLPDRYGYLFGERRVQAAGLPDSAPRFPCQADAATPVPDRPPRVLWRAGLDLHPLDLTDAGQMAWLETLVWPEQSDRAARLRAAIEVARADPPRVVAGDLRQDLAALAAEAPPGATLVIFHTAVLAYVTDQEDRSAFARLAASLADAWISNEASGVLPGITAAEPGDRRDGRFLLTVNAAPVAWTDPHGAAMEWIADPPDPNSAAPYRKPSQNV